MEYTILLDRKENLKEIEAQERNRFVKLILEQLELPIEYDPDTQMSVEQSIEFKKELKKFNLHPVISPDGALKLYVERDLIGEWYKPQYKLKQDHSVLDRKNQLYLEMNVKFWSIFEEEQNQSTEEVE